MERRIWRFCLCLLFIPEAVWAQQSAVPRTLTWSETEAIFRAHNPELLAGKVTIDESRADEITAFLRPNPDFNAFVDQLTPYSGTRGFRPIWQAYPSAGLDYLHERAHKRELRLQSAQRATALAISSQADLERNLLFDLRDAFDRVLLSKAIYGIAKEDLEYYDKEIALNKERYNAGDIARVDFERIELQRAQFESDLQTSVVNIRTAKIDLLALLRDTTPVEEFDVNETFDFAEPTSTLADLRYVALTARPDLREAEEALEKARTDHQLSIANGSTDPTISVNGSRQAPPINTYFGVGVSIPLRIFDRNQGDKLHTLLDISRNQKLRDQAEVTALHDVDSAYATLESTIRQLRPYKEKWLHEAEDIRDTVTYAYQHGGGTLLDFLQAQRDYRDTRIAYLNLIGSYFSAANQVNFSVGREVIQ